MGQLRARAQYFIAASMSVNDIAELADFAEKSDSWDAHLTMRLGSQVDDAREKRDRQKCDESGTRKGHGATDHAAAAACAR